MSSGQWITGCVIMLTAAAGGGLSAPWAERTFTRPETPTADSGKAGEGPHKRTCITISGKRFEWDHPNTPFGTLSCSD